MQGKQPDFAPKALTSIVRVGGAMGVVVDGNYILTAAHVVSMVPGFFATGVVTTPVSRWPARHGTARAALLAYEAERRPATTDLVLLNRKNGPEQVMQLVEERAPDGFGVVTDVLSQQELETIAANYKRVAGFQVEGLNAKPPIVQRKAS